jgi:hypothetical protein
MTNPLTISDLREYRLTGGEWTAFQNLADIAGWLRMSTQALDMMIMAGLVRRERCSSGQWFDSWCLTSDGVDALASLPERRGASLPAFEWEQFVYRPLFVIS